MGAVHLSTPDAWLGMDPARVLLGAVSAPLLCDAAASVQCTSFSSLPSASPSLNTSCAFFNLVAGGFGRNRSTVSSTNCLSKFPLPKTRISVFGRGRDGLRLGFPVKARAEGGRADGQAESEAGFAGDENGRTGWSGEQDSKKAKALVESTIYPIMRVYRDDLCTLEVTGDAKASEAIEAMAADGGFTAAEELSKGRSLMTVETIIPGRWDDHSTVSTKLLAPTQLVSKTARTIWTRKKVTMSSGNALARAFQKVVMQHLLSFDIHLRSPGTVRDMANLANEKEDAVVASLESRNAGVLDVLAEAVSAYSLANIEDNFHQRLIGKDRHEKGFAFRRKPDWIWASNKAIGVRSLSENEIWEHAKEILDKQDATGEINRTHQAWWPFPSRRLPSQIVAGQGLNSSWSTEFIPIHKVQIDTSKVKVLAKGWQTTQTEHVLELSLTHSQLVDIADMLDLYYEDVYTAPGKALRTGVELRVSHLSKSKVMKTLWTAVLSCVVGGVLLVGLLVVARLRNSSPTDLLSTTSSVASSSSRSDSSFTNKWCRVRTDRQPLLPKNNDIQAEEMEALCLQVVNRIKDAFNLEGQVESSPETGAWIGSDLSQMGRRQKLANMRVNSAGGDGDDLLDRTHEEADGQRPSLENVESKGLPETLRSDALLLYQVVLSRNGTVLGFQPGNKPAIGRWVEFPFAQELHKGRRLGSGLFERGLKYSEMLEDAVAIELLCNADSNFPAVTATPLKL